MKYSYLPRLLACLLTLIFLRPGPLLAAPFQPGNLVVARVGDGSAALTSAAAAVFLDEYTPAGALVQTISLPTSVSGSNRILTASGTGVTELNLTRSADGRYLLLAGYGTNPGTTAVSNSTAADVARVIGRISADGSVDTRTSAGDAFSSNNIRAVASADGESFYAVGGNSGVRYVPFGGVSSTQLNTTLVNSRYVNTFGGNLYVSSSSGGFVGVSQVGTGLPTTAGQTVTLLPGAPGGGTNASPYAFYFADLSPEVPGLDVLYVVDDRSSSTNGGIQKWSLVSGTWVFNGNINNATGASLRGLTGTSTGTSASLVASGPTSLFLVTDNAGYNVAPSTTVLPTALATPAANTQFRGVSFAPVVAAPTIISFTPTAGLAGSTTVTLTGTNFTDATAVSLNGVAITGFTVVDATTITFAVPAGASSGLIAVTTSGGTVTSTTAFTVTTPNPVPTITALAPATIVAGSADFTLTVNGTGFVAGSVIGFNGAALTTTVVSATQLTAMVPAAAVATAGTYNVTVTSPAPGGGTSTAATFTLTVPAPTISSFTPGSGLPGTVVTVTGSNFTGATAVTLNGGAVSSFTVVSSTTLTLEVPAGATSGALAITTPGGTATSATSFTVLVPNPVPTISGLTPATAVAGSADLTLTVNGTGFGAASVVSFNGQTLATTLVSATQLTAVVPAAALATAGSYNVLVTNPAPGGGSSAAATFTVTVPAPPISSFTPTTGGPGITVTIIGTNFTGATAVRIGTLAVTTFMVVSPTSITFTVPASTANVSGAVSVVTPGGTATSTAQFNLVTAVLASQALPGLRVYPNPATDRLTVQLPTTGAATVALRDLTGRVVLAPAALPADQQLRLPASLAAGVYLLEVRQGTTTAVRRIQKN